MKLLPAVAGCAGAWSVAGIFPSPLRSGVAACATNGDDSATSANGAGCSAIDLCSVGWHICKADEVAGRTNGLVCTGSAYGTTEFYAASVSGTGCNVCAVPSNTDTSTTTCTTVSCASNCKERPDLNNDFFGCGSMGVNVGAGSCTLNRASNDQCAALTAGGWTCPSSIAESRSVTKTLSTGGGVLCCRGPEGG